MRRASYGDSSVYVQNRGRARLLLPGWINCCGHSETDLRSIRRAHGTWLSVSPRPTESVRASLVAFAQLFARPGFIFVFVKLRVVPQTKFDWINTNILCEFVQSTFQRIDSGRFARRTHRAGRSQIQPDELMRNLDVRTRVQHARHIAARLGVFGNGRAMGCGRVTQRHQFSIFIRADRKPLFSACPLTGRIEHLRSRESDLHGSLHQFRCSRCEQGMAPLKSF